MGTFENIDMFALVASTLLQVFCFQSGLNINTKSINDKIIYAKRNKISIFAEFLPNLFSF